MTPRRKTVLAVVSGLLVLGLSVAGFGFWFVSDMGRMIRWFGTPDHPFAEIEPPPPPDYSALASWAAHPEILDPSDSLPVGVPPSSPEHLKMADVFFVHPTTYLLGGSWNAPIDAPTAAGLVDDFVLPLQAGAFSDCCRVYAPRYRQAIFHSFLEKDGTEGEAALDLAYSDVLRAFETFLESTGDRRPFILAGHSQGTLHSSRLLQERIAGTSLQKRLIAAYLVGFPTPEGLEGVPACRTPQHTGCVVAWQTMEESGAEWPDTRNWVGGWTREVKGFCTNPLSWELGGSAPASLHKGATWLEDDVPRALVPEFTDARCDGGRLIITPPADTSAFPYRMGEGKADWHVYDYNVFYGNIRANAVTRTYGWLAAGAYSTP